MNNARQYLGISAQEFERRLDVGDVDIDDPDVTRVAMLLWPRAESP
jgi:hypothetical protein